MAILPVLLIAAGASVTSCDMQETICDKAEDMCRQCRESEDLDSCLRTADACRELPDIDDMKDACCRQFLDTLGETCDS